MGGIENALKALRNYPRVSIFNLRDLPYSRPPPYHGLKRKKRGLGHRGVSQYQAYPPLGTQEGRTPFYITVPREPYNQDHFSRHALPRLSLLDLQRMIDLSRVDPTQPIDLTTFCNTGLFRIDVEHERHYGVHLTEEGLDSFVTPVNIEVQYASEEVIAAIERVGGVITTRFYDLLSVLAKSDPYAFFRMGMPIPRGKKPPAAAEGLAGLGNPAGHYIVDFYTLREGAAQLGVVQGLHLGAIRVDLGCEVGSTGWRLMHNHRLLRVDDEVEVVAGGGEEVHAPLHVPF
nr:unnamed protein product [Spirometra erinaceieuropaei]